MTMALLDPPLALRIADLGDTADCARIDDFVRAHRGTPFHCTGWSRAVERGCGQRAHYLVAETAAGAIAGVLPTNAVRSPLFGAALVSAGFAVDGGVLGGDAALGPLSRAAWALAEQLRCPTLELRGGPVPGDGWQVDETTYVGFARDLAADDAAQLTAIPRKQRAEVRKALAHDFEIAIGNDAAAARAHYAVYAESVRNLGTPVFPAALFRAMLDQFGNAADVLTVRHQGRAVASVLSFYVNDTVYPYWGGGTFEARGLRANDAMYYALMCHARSRGCTRFDFGRSKIGTGAAAFKKNWGFDPEPLAYAVRTADGAAKREINPLSPRYRLQVRVWQKLPLWLANFMGPWIAKGLG
ncbi:FemAB family XrtA/PEP-CTERM system-associated protein [Hephaestia sp. GCM10023244]|uniref:FemAB family XrtA/PEP-CTERM system-associated protein n=1 Tax=unclassified Hephaestia TaxID=2631281 RepID=UPI00207738FF|nr:FemAB family XrtA/PEP-CTERM system-associated protein [Hephaestia sp. MAHUQ-44]MCM8732143.1 FemAB family PEP-CTERM system-associated protein [Hephaestia sp. MAHUQ-44]